MRTRDRGRPPSRLTIGVAAVCSLFLHLVLIALAAPGLAPVGEEASSPEAVTVVPVPTEPAGVEPRREPPTSAAPSEAPAAGRPLLAAASRPTPTEDETRLDVPTLEPTARPEPAAAPAATREPVALPSPREAAIRDLVRRAPRPPTEAEALEGRLDEMLAGALRPLPNDKSPAPRLRPDSEGNLVWAHRGLGAKIRPDGTVDFEVRHGASVEGFESGEDGLIDQHTRLPGVPLVRFDPPPPSCASAGPPSDGVGLGATIRPNFDLNDLALAAVGDDPLAAQKRWFLRQTEELRDGLADKTRRREASLAPGAAVRRAEEVFRDRSLSASERRRLLFELWDECEEPAEADDPRLEAEAGRRSRERIEALVRRRLPAGSEHAYGEAELRRLNASRTSLRPFDPYRR